MSDCDTWAKRSEGRKAIIEARAALGGDAGE